MRQKQRTATDSAGTELDVLQDKCIVEPLSMPHSLQVPESDRSDHDLPSEPRNLKPGDQSPPPEREQLQCRLESGEDTSDASDDESEVKVTTDVPRGPQVTQKYVDTVNAWWQSEIEPWKSMILDYSGYKAKRYDSMNQWDQWIYRKYRFVHHFF